MSGDIAVPKDAQETILWRTLEECVDQKLVTLEDINQSICRISVTALGRVRLK